MLRLEGYYLASLITRQADPRSSGEYLPRKSLEEETWLQTI
jgi:hypothetical protein